MKIIIMEDVRRRAHRKLIHLQVLEVVAVLKLLFKPKFILFGFCLLFLNTAFSQNHFDTIFIALNKSFRGESCETPSIPNDEKVKCDKRQMAPERIRNSMTAISEKLFYNRLAEFDLDRVKCAREQWSSLLVGPESESLLTEKLSELNTWLEALQDIKDKIEGLSRKMSQAPYIGGLRGIRNPQIQQITNSTQKVNKKLESEILLLQALYQQKLSEIQNSDNTVFSQFIQKHLSQYGKPITPVSKQDLNKLIVDSIYSLNAKEKELQQSMQNGNNPSIDEQVRLSSDPDLIAKMINENPYNLDLITNYQCSAVNRQTLRNNAETALNVSTIALPIGSLAMAKAAHTAIAMRALGGASRIETAAKTLGWSAAVLGGTHGLATINEQCPPKLTAETTGSCSLKISNVQEAKARNSCLWIATVLAATGKGAGSLKTLGTAGTRDYASKLLGRSVNDAQALKLKNLADFPEANRLNYLIGSGFTREEAEKILKDLKSSAVVRAQPATSSTAVTTAVRSPTPGSSGLVSTRVSKSTVLNPQEKFYERTLAGKINKKVAEDFIAEETKRQNPSAYARALPNARTEMQAGHLDTLFEGEIQSIKNVTKKLNDPSLKEADKKSLQESLSIYKNRCNAIDKIRAAAGFIPRFEKEMHLCKD